MSPQASEVVEFESERLTIESDLDAYGLLGVTKDDGNAILQVAIEIVARSEGAKTFLRAFEALSMPGNGVVTVMRDGDKTKIAAHTACSSAEAKKALEGAGGDS